MQALLLPVGGDLYALRMADVREVVSGPILTRLPTAPATVLGLLSLRGELVPVLDTGALLGVGPLGGAPWCVVLDVVADGLAGVCALATDGLPRAGRLDDLEGPSTALAALGTFGAEGRLATLVDPAALIAPVRG